MDGEFITTQFSKGLLYQIHSWRTNSGNLLLQQHKKQLRMNLITSLLTTRMIRVTHKITLKKTRKLSSTWKMKSPLVRIIRLSLGPTT